MRVLILVLLALLPTAALAHRESGGTAKIAGLVTFADGSPAADTTVVIGREGVVTDGSGHYVMVTSPGYAHLDFRGHDGRHFQRTGHEQWVDVAPGKAHLDFTIVPVR